MLFALLPLFSCNFDTRESEDFPLTTSSNLFLILPDSHCPFSWIAMVLFRALSSDCHVCLSSSLLLIGCGHGLDCLLAGQKELASLAGNREGITKRHERWEMKGYSEGLFCFLCSLPSWGFSETVDVAYCDSFGWFWMVPKGYNGIFPIPAPYLLRIEIST